MATQAGDSLMSCKLPIDAHTCLVFLAALPGEGAGHLQLHNPDQEAIPKRSQNNYTNRCLLSKPSVFVCLISGSSETVSSLPSTDPSFVESPYVNISGHWNYTIAKSKGDYSFKTRDTLECDFTGGAEGMCFLFASIREVR
jgi:hypothetical protein